MNLDDRVPLPAVLALHVLALAFLCGMFGWWGVPLWIAALLFVQPADGPSP